MFIPLKELIYTQGQMYNLKITNKSGNIWEFCDRKWANPDVRFDARIVNVTAGRLNSSRLRGITNQHRLTDHHSNLINRRGLKTETSK